MPETAVSSVPAKARSRPAAVTAMKVALFYLVVMKFAQAVFFFFWGKFSIEPLLEMIGKWHIDNYREALGSIYSLSVAPLDFALLTILAPLVGWWVYSRVEPAKQTLVGWLAAVLYVVSDATILVVTTTFDPLSVSLVSGVIALVYIMFCMGIGFNIAKLFRLRL
ncbi:MAG TPA: hypothetical protein VG839_07060 [Asticcacaulis sp.]|nr:hypothetical protein [Asticcacaulis sp.]